MFDYSGDIKKNIDGWIMHINEQEDMKSASDINNILQYISEVKPLLINIDACEVSKHVINRIVERQIQQRRYFWIKSDRRINTNFTQGKFKTNDPKASMISAFVRSLHESRRVLINAVGSTPPEVHQRFGEDLSGQELEQ